MSITSEKIANLALASMCLTVTYAVAERYIFTHASSAENVAVAGYHVGDTLTDTPEALGVARSRLSAIVLVSNHCRFCAESASFYQRLLALRNEYPPREFQTVFLGADGEADAEAFVRTHQLAAPAFAPTPSDLAARVPGTPALFLVEADGRITSSWTGKLTAAAEQSVMSVIAAHVRNH